MPVYRDPGPIEFDAVIERADVSGSSAFVAFPFNVAERFGVKGRVPVAASFDGTDYRGSLVTYGGPNHLLLVLADIQERIGKRAGDTVHVRVELDTAERVVDLDDDVIAALTSAEVYDRFRRMSYSHQREYALWIAEAKKPETRSRRIETLLELVREGKRLK